MKTKSETRTIHKWVYRAIDESAITKVDYAESVVDHFDSTIPLGEQGKRPMFLQWDDESTVKQYERARHQNMIKVMRYVDGEVQIPLMLRRSLIFGLPKQYRIECQRELYMPEGSHYAAIDGFQGERLDYANIHDEYADTVRTASQLLADGVVDENDSDDALSAHEKELLDLKAEVEAQLLHLKEVRDRKKMLT